MSAAARDYIVAARKFAAQFKGFLAIADELEKIESFDLAISEAQRRLAELREQEIAARENAAKIIAQAQMRAQRHEDDGKNAAQAHIDAGRATAHHALATATAQAHDIIAAAEQLAEQHAHKRQELTGMDDMIGAARVEHAGVLAEIETARNAVASAHAEHERVKTIIAEAKAKF